MKSFQEILEKRVRSTNASALDFYTVEKALIDVCKELFGNAGKENVRVKKWDNGILILSAEKSLWRTELALNQQVLISKTNKLLNKQAVKKIIIVQ